MKKTTKGHKGFEFVTNKDVTLEQDLLRRDLTINAIAQDQNGKFIDPYNGLIDLENRVMRHVSDAFVEDPLRVFRVARFYAKYKQYGFTIHESTYKIMQKISNSNEIETFVKRETLGRDF